MGFLENNHCVKSVRIWSYSGRYFPSFGLRIQSERGKIQTRITPTTNTFYTVNALFPIKQSTSNFVIKPITSATEQK